MPSITVELSDEEYGDLKEMVQRHPERFHDEAAALKALGLEQYSKLKRKYDPQRKRPMALLGLLEEQQMVPCTFSEAVEHSGDSLLHEGEFTYFPAAEGLRQEYNKVCEFCQKHGEVPPTISDLIKWGVEVFSKLGLGKEGDENADSR